MKDWDLISDPYLVIELAKRAQQVAADVEQVAATLATELKNQIVEPGKEQSEKQSIEPSEDFRVDGINQVLDLKNPRQDGTIPLTLGDLKTPEDFHYWCNKASISAQVGNQPVKSFKDGLNQCVIIQFLYERAKILDNTAIPESKVWTPIYLRLVKQLAAQTHCSLNASVSETQQITPSGQSAASVDQTLGRVLSPGPLTRSEINFDRIRNYFEQLKPLMAETKGAAQIDALIAKTEQTMSHVAEISSSTNFSLGIPSNTFLGYVNKNPANYIYLIDALKNIIFNVQNTLAILRQYYSQPIQDNTQIEQLMAGQIGRGPEDSSIWQDNNAQLTKLRDRHA